MEKKKKTTKLGEIDTKDIVKSKASKQVDDSTVIPNSKKEGYGKVGPYDAFGESKTKSLGRAMQENKNKNLGEELAKKMTEEAILRAKKRKAK